MEECHKSSLQSITGNPLCTQPKHEEKLLGNKLTLQTEEELKPKKISYFFVTINASLLKGLKGRAVTTDPQRTAPAPAHHTRSAEQ